MQLLSCLCLLNGLVENIFLDNILMRDIVNKAFTFSLYYANKPVGGKADKDTSAEDAIPPVTEETPCFRNIFLDNIICTALRELSISTVCQRCQ